MLTSPPVALTTTSPWAAASANVRTVSLEAVRDPMRTSWPSSASRPAIA
jgi:hypothetical protein